MASFFNYLLNFIDSFFNNGDSPVEVEASTQTRRMQDSRITEQNNCDSDGTEVNVIYICPICNRNFNPETHNM